MDRSGIVFVNNVFILFRKPYNFLLPLQYIEWYGVLRGYNVSYRRASTDTPLEAVSIEDHNANSFVLEGLEEFTLYQVIVQGYNDVGSSLPSPPAMERTRESSK